MWLAHALTLSRVPLAAALWWSYGSPLWSAAIVALAALSDALDGTVARWARRRSGTPLDDPSPGDWLDPLADKLFAVIAIATFIAHEPDQLGWLLLIATRELLQLPFAVVYALAPNVRARLGRLKAQPLGKVATIAQLVAIAFVAIQPKMTPELGIVSGLLGLAAVIERVVTASRAPAPESR